MPVKFVRFATSGGLALAMSLALAACDKADSLVAPTPNTDPVVVSVRVDPTTISTGTTAEVTAVVTDADGDS